ncbi:protein-lysine N-methyltransferase [soil metagenome]
MLGMFLLSQGIIILIILVLLILLSFVWPPDSPWSPWWKTSDDVSRAICTLAQVGKGDIVYELGSGNGTTLKIARKEFHAKKCVGVEIDPLRVWVSRLLLKYYNITQITILRNNFFQVDITEATVVYVYLVPKALKKLQKKFLSELKPGTRVASYIYKIPYLKQVDINKQHHIYLYTI